MPKISLLLDENIGVKATNILRNNDFGVESILENHRGISDRKVLELADEESRILVTLDKDFGRLVFKELEDHSGVIFLRLNKETDKKVAETILEVYNKYEEELQGKFLTVTDTEIRLLHK